MKKKTAPLVYMIIGLLTIMSAAVVPNVSAEESSDGYFIRKWLTLGPFIKADPSQEAINVDYLLLATGVSEQDFAIPVGAPKPNDRVSLALEGQAMQERLWKVSELPENGNIREMLAQEGEIDFSFAYLFAFIGTREVTRQEMNILFHDDVKVFFNGEVVHTGSGKVTLLLKEGINCLMLKVANLTRESNLIVGFEDKGGLKFFHTPSPRLFPLGRRPPRLLNPKVETKLVAKSIWKTYRYVDGLAGNYVRAIMQDAEGVVWFGTRHGGISRFNGVNWKTYRRKDGLASNEVRAIMQDNNGLLWFGTQNGVSRFDGKSSKTYTEADGLADHGINAILQDSKGNIWFGTEGGVNRFDGENWITYKRSDGLVASDHVNSILQDNKGNIWFGTSEGASLFDGTNWSTYTERDGLANSDVRAILQDDEGVIWFGTYDGASRFDGENWKTYKQRDGLTSNYVRAIMQDDEGAIWFGTYDGVSRFDGKDWRTYKQRDGLASNYVNAIMQDGEGAIWFGTEGDGVSRFDGKSWKTYTKRREMANNDIRSITQDDEGAIWFGTWDSGVIRFDGENWITYTQRDGLAGYGANAILQDDEGVIWFGSGGVSRFDGENWKTYRPKSRLAGNHVRAIMQDNEGAIWFGTLLGGANRFDGENWITYTQKDGLAGKRVNAVSQDGKGAIWFGTYDGVSRFDGENWITYTQKDGLVDNRVTAILHGAEGAIWFGTLDGVSRFDGANWKTYTKKDGLASNWVNAILQDEEGTIWFGTEDGGISRFDGRCFQTVDSRDGLASDSVSCMYMDGSGRIWLGTKNGVIRFIPNKIPPPVYITQTLADEIAHSCSGELLNLSAEVTRVAFNFHAISFKTRPGEMLYYYQLVGHDQGWQGPIREEFVEYFNLEQGRYIFKVQAVDRDLNYSDPPASISILIPAPPFYQAEIFLNSLSIIGVVSLISLIILVMYRWRSFRSEKLRLQQELEDARQMQFRLLPKSVPHVEGFDIAGFSHPAREVGGDFFDYLFLPDGRIGIALADVSGKGLKGAMNAVLANGMLHEVVKIETSCGKILSALNTDLYPRMEKQMFTTLGLAILDQNTKSLQWANAAQPYPIIKRQDQVFEFRSDNELPLGMIRNLVYPDWELEPQVGDIVVFYTDGILEAENGAEEIYGSERMEQVITNIDPAMNAEEIIKAILQDITGFVGSTEQYDDMTVVVVKRL